MGPCPATTPFLREDCPWKASALIAAFTQLLLSVILLLNGVVICLTFHVLRLCGLVGKNPSICGSLANDGTRSPGGEDASGIRKRSRSRHCTSCNAPKRQDILDVSDDDDDADDDDDDDSSSTRRLNAVEAGPCSDSSSSMCNNGSVVASTASPGDAPFLDRKASHSKRICSILRTSRSFCKRNGSILDRSGSISDRSGSISDRSGSISERNVTKRDPSSERQASFLERRGSFLKRKGPGLERSSSFCDTSRSFCDRPKKEVASKPSSTSGNDGIKDLKGSPREMADDKSEGQQSAAKNGTKKLCFLWENSCTCSGRMGSATSQQEIEGEPGCFNDESSSSTMTENGDGDELIRKLRKALQVERDKLRDLYSELEHERIAAETAANETLTKILHLQEEKAALRMQAEHYQRMAEEKATYDEHAMLIMKDILYRKERENYLLEIEIDMIRRRLEGERERRMGPEAAPVSASSDDNPVLLIKDANEPKDSQGKSIQSCSRQEGQGDESDDSSTASSSIIERRHQSRGNNMQSSSFRGDVHSYNRSRKRLKTAKFVQDVVLVDVQSQPRFRLVENHGKKLKYMTSYDNGCEANKHPEQFNEETKSVSATASGDDSRLVIEEASLDDQGKQEELNPEGTYRLFESILPDTVVLAKRNKSSMKSMNHAAKEMFWMEFNHYKAGNESLYNQTSGTAPTSGKREDPSEEVVQSIFHEQV